MYYFECELEFECGNLPQSSKALSLECTWMWERYNVGLQVSTGSVYWDLFFSVFIHIKRPSWHCIPYWDLNWHKVWNVHSSWKNTRRTHSWVLSKSSSRNVFTNQTASSGKQKHNSWWWLKIYLQVIFLVITRSFHIILTYISCYYKCLIIILIIGLF